MVGRLKDSFMMLSTAMQRKGLSIHHCDGDGLAGGFRRPSSWLRQLSVMARLETCGGILPIPWEAIVFSCCCRICMPEPHYLWYFSPPGQRDEVIHGQLCCRHSAAAIMATAFGTSPFPPLGLSQLPGFLSFPIEILLVQIISIGLHGVSLAAVAFNGRLTVSPRSASQLSISFCSIA